MIAIIIVLAAKVFNRLNHDLHQPTQRDTIPPP